MFILHQMHNRHLAWRWLDRPLSDSFFDLAGRHSEEEVCKLFEAIPRYYKNLAYTIILLSGEVANNPEYSSCFGFRHVLFYASEKVKDYSGIDLKLPHYWYADGVMIPPELIVRITNGIVGWRCDESYKRCLMEGGCRYYPKSEVID